MFRPMKTSSLLIFVLSFFIGLQTLAKPTSYSAVVEKISDGDTIQVKIDGSKKSSKVRLLGLDTPETDFNGANQGKAAILARDFLKSLIPINSKVTLEVYANSEDIHQRLLVVVILNNIDLNQVMLSNGMAFIYFIFPYDKSLQKKYAITAKDATENKRGLFTDEYKNLVAPYIFRQEQKGSEGTMVVANESTKKLFHQIDIQHIPQYDRVFFAIPEQAIERGFSW